MSFPDVISSGVGTGESLFTKFGLPLFLGGTAVFSTINCFTVVKKGHAGVRMRLGETHGKNGQLHGILGPGLHLRAPFIGSIPTINTQKRPRDIPEFKIERGEVQYDVLSQILWRVMYEARNPEGKKYGSDDNPYLNNVWRAMFNVPHEEALAEAVTNQCGAGIREVMETLTENKFKVNSEVDGGVKEIVNGVNGTLEKDYGVRLLGVTLRSVSLTSAEKVSAQISKLSHLTGLSAITVADTAVPDLHVFSP